MSLEEKTVLMPKPERVAIGTQLSGTYELDERIASGGMGEVFRGHNIHNGDPVAIKIVLPEYARDPTILALFRKEGMVLKRLAHDAIVRYEIFTVDPGIERPYIAMEFVDGASLADLMARGPMPASDARVLLARLASGLVAAHDLGVIHRDLSPDNVILPGGDVGRAKIIDFGIARAATIGDATVVGSAFAGKYAFVSPEQLGMAGGEVTPRSDIYSLGLVVAAALRGRPLDLDGSQFEVIEKRRNLPDLAGIDADLLPLLRDMLRPDPAARPASMADIVQRLATLGLDEAPAPADPGTGTGMAAPARAVEPDAVSATTPAPDPGLPNAAGDKTVIVPRPVPPPEPLPEPAPMRAAPAPSSPPVSSAEPTWIAATRSARAAGTVQPPSWDTPPPPMPAPPWATGSGQAPVPPATSAVPPPPTGEEEVPWRIAGLGPRPAPAATPPLSGDPPPLPGSAPRKPSRGRAAPLLVAAGFVAIVAAGAGVWWSGILGGGTTEPAPPQEAASPQDDPPAPPPAAATPPKPAKEAAVQPTAGNALKAVASAADRVAWLDAYRGDPCFYVSASSVSGAEMSMQGLGQSEAPFHKLIADYAARFGSEGDMTVQLIRPSQCAVTDFLSALHAPEIRGPKLSLEQFKLSDREPLTGEVEPGEGAFTYLLLVDDDGIAHDVTRFIDPKAGRSTFTIPISLKPDTKAAANGVPALLVAVTAPGRIGALDGPAGQPASQLLPAILAELGDGKAKAGAAARYFVIEG